MMMIIYLSTGYHAVLLVLLPAFGHVFRWYVVIHPPHHRLLFIYPPVSYSYLLRDDDLFNLLPLSARPLSNLPVSVATESTREV